MSKTKIALIAFVVLALLALGLGGGWYVHTKLPVREGRVDLEHLGSVVTVKYDERGVPHIHADNQPDLYRALGYVHAQDRLFQMEMLRRLANGELAEVLGPKLLDNDRLFRTLGIREHARSTAAAMDMKSPAAQVLSAYLDGVNQFQATHPAPLVLISMGISRRSIRWHCWATTRTSAGA